MSSKALAFDNGNSPRAQLSRRHKSPALLWVVTAVSFSFFHFLLLFFFSSHLIDLKKERTAGHSQTQIYPLL